LKSWKPNSFSTNAASRALLAAVAFLLIGCSHQAMQIQTPIKVEIVRSGAGYQLLRGGQPYKVKGAGMTRDDIASLVAHGGNSIRNWSTDDKRYDIRGLLDSAYAHGATVVLCLPMKAERHGFDYNDEAAVAEQFRALRKDVLKYRDHPALLAWIIGNELNHSYSNPRVFDAVNDVARMIHELDPNHPVTTAMSGFHPEVIAEALKRAPALDFLSFQNYGSLFSLPKWIMETGLARPFMVTEWGTIGYWEMEKTRWGAPVELTSSEKADVILRAWREVLAPLEGQLIGSYVFKWGWKQERTPTWFGLLLDSGEETESVDVMHYIWNGAWPKNRSPRVKSLQLDGKGAREGVTLVAGRTYEAGFDVVDPEGDPLRFHWEVKPESDAMQAGGDFEERIGSLGGLLRDPAAATTAITVKEPGKYRLFAYAYDGHGHAAHANIPFLVTAAGAR
jgi:hypothetical protein